MHLQGKKRFQIGLDTGAATGITATDRKRNVLTTIEVWRDLSH